MDFSRSRYAQFADPALASWVQSFWTLRAGGETSRILPDGCMDFIFNLETGGARVVGTMTSSQLVAPARGARYFGVRFAPGAAAALIDAPAAALCDGDGTLDELVPVKRYRLAERVADARDDRDRARIIGAFIRDAGSRTRPVDHRLQRATELLRQSHGIVSIASVAQRIGISERHLERLFLERVGTRPKLFARVLRMQRALLLLEAASASAPAHRAVPRAGALDAGFADEPHLVREFRALAGLTPQRLLRERHVGSVQSAAEPSG